MPEGMKIAYITPLFKSGDRTDPRNYRPLSLLPIVSKILERLVHEQLTTFIAENNLLPITQCAYRPLHSTEDALTIASERLLEARDSRKVSAAVFIDLSKAFDKVQHPLLVRQLQNIGMGGSVLSWFVDYLSNRKQCVVIGNQKSTLEAVTSGVPQGSVLGPTLFPLYVRDIATAIQPQSVQLLQFADDIMLLDSNPVAQVAATNMSAAVSNLADWLRDRNLILNEKKSHVLWISPNERVENVSVMCHNVEIPRVTEAKYLGVVLDEGLSWKTHVSAKSLAAIRSIGALRRANNSLCLKAKWLYYSSVIMPNLIYGSNAYLPNLPVACMNRFIKLQKRALRAIFGLPPWAHTAPLFLMFDETNVLNKMLRKLALLVWRTQNRSCGSLLADIFHQRLTRATRGSTSHTLLLPEANRLSGLKRPSFYGAVSLEQSSCLCTNGLTLSALS